MTKPIVAPGDEAREQDWRNRTRAASRRFREKHWEEIKAKYAIEKEAIQARRRADRIANPERYRAYDRKRVRVFTEEQKEHIRETARTFWANNPEWAAAKRRKTDAWRKANKDRDYARDREYRARNSEKVAIWRGTSKSRKLHRKWYAANPARGRATQKRYYEKNPEKAKANAATGRARRANAPGRWTKDDISKMKVAQRGRCAYCPVALGKKFHIDHIIPLAKGGTNWPKNLQLLCAPCNMRKHDKDPIEYAREIGLLV